MNIDYFYFYGDVEIRDEIKQDIMVGILTDKRSMYYNRSYGAGVLSRENSINDTASQILIKYDAVVFMARRNMEVSDGSGTSRDRRAITSQNFIDIYSIKDEKGIENMVNVDLSYIPMFDIQVRDTISTRVGGI